MERCLTLVVRSYSLGQIIDVCRIVPQNSSEGSVTDRVPSLSCQLQTLLCLLALPRLLDSCMSSWISQLLTRKQLSDPKILAKH